MAEIKVRKKGPPAWVWIVLALIAAALLWWAISTFAGDNASPAPETVPAAEPQPAAPPSAPAADAAVTDVSTLLDASDPTALVGREVRLRDVPVPEMVGDATFWVSDASGRRVFVILDEHIPSPPPEVEGRVNVNAGQTVDIDGVVRASDDLPGGDVLDQQDSNTVAGQPIYVWARSATVASRP